MSKVIALSNSERVVAVVPEPCSGRGWTNELLTVYIHDTFDGTLRVVHLQPSEQPDVIHHLFAPGAAMARALQMAIEPLLRWR